MSGRERAPVFSLLLFNGRNKIPFYYGFCPGPALSEAGQRRHGLCLGGEMISESEAVDESAPAAFVLL